MRLAWLVLVAWVERAISYEEKPFTCPDGTKISSIQVCDGKRQCHDYDDFGDYDDENYNLCVDPQPINFTLNLVTHKYENGTVDLVWLPDEAPFNDTQNNIGWHDTNGVHITLAGYFLTVKSVEETVNATLEASSKNHRLTSLKPWTDYEVILRPFYAKNGKTNEMYRIGRASTTMFRSPAAAPPRPVGVNTNIRGHSPSTVKLDVFDSHNRHGEPAGHRVRWKLHGDGTSLDGDGQADFGIHVGPNKGNWLSITLAPGRHYTLYISALNKGLNDTVIAGEELETEVATIPPQPADVDAQFIGPRSVNVTWRSVGFAGVFLVAVCNAPCPPVSRVPPLLLHAVPSLHASYLLTYVHGSLEDQIRKMSDRLQINYVLVKVDGSGEESKEYNILIETPFLPKHLSVSMASVYMGKCSHTVTRRVSEKENTPPRPINVASFPNKGGMSLKITDDENRNGKGAGHRVRWKLHGGSTYGDGQADFGYQRLGSSDKNENLVHLKLEPGRYYTLYISAINQGENNTVIVGPEIKSDVTTVPNEPVNVDAQFIGPRIVNVTWRSVGFADVFLVAVCNGSCPPLSRKFVPSPHASYLLTYVHGSLEEQIRKMSDRLQINYILVKVDGNPEGSKENNVFIETPFLPTHPSISMASCYMGKCSHDVTKLVSEKKNTPPRPIDVNFFFHDNGLMVLLIIDPESRNGKSAGHRLWWKLHEGSADGDGQAHFDRWSLDSNDHTKHWVSLTLQRGRYYTLYISAINEGENNTDILGPEFRTEVATIPNEPIEVSAESIAPNKVYVKWRSVGSADIFLVALCNGSCPPLSRDFVPSPRASYLLTNVYGSVKEQINLMSKRPYMDYVLVKVERGSEESSLHNILLELPAIPTIPSVSVASCYFDKCSHSVSTMVETKEEGLRVPTEVEVTPPSEEEAWSSGEEAWTGPDEPPISAME